MQTSINKKLKKMRQAIKEKNLIMRERFSIIIIFFLSFRVVLIKIKNVKTLKGFYKNFTFKVNLLIKFFL